MKTKGMVLFGIICFSCGFLLEKVTGNNFFPSVDVHAEDFQKKVSEKNSGITAGEQQSSLKKQINTPTRLTLQQFSASQSSLRVQSIKADVVSLSSNAVINDEDLAKKIKTVAALPEISDESIDDLVPAPYNVVLKAMHGKVRNKYIDFAEAVSQSDWDTNAENTINDVFNNGQYGNKFLIDAISCKANFCEIRILEREPNGSRDVWSENLAALSKLGTTEIAMSSFSDEKNNNYAYWFIYKLDVNTNK